MYLSDFKLRLVKAGSQASSVGITTGLSAGRPGFDSRQGVGIFLFTTSSRRTLGPTQPLIQWLPATFFAGNKAAEG
jgi:hypothetical protein